MPISVVFHDLGMSCLLRTLNKINSGPMKLVVLWIYTNPAAKQIRCYWSNSSHVEIRCFPV